MLFLSCLLFSLQHSFAIVGKILYIMTETKISKTEYIKTRFTELLPTKQQFREEKKNINPLPGLRLMKWRDWQFYILGFLAWTWDGFDYFSVSLNVSELAHDLNKSVTDITWGITLVLMLRSVGAVGSGYLADRYGRKWPFIGNLALLIALQIGLGFIKTYKQFLAVRALFGIVMGAIYGLASATALEGAPAEARSFLSGLFQEGYAFGYLLVVIFQRAITDNSSHRWRALFWFSAGPPVLVIAWRLMLPETDAFLQQQIHMKKSENQFFKDAKAALKTHWLTFIYLVLLMAGFNFMSHGSQDLYPTLLTKQLHLSSDASTVTNSLANIGALVGGMIFGHFSGIIGRRFGIILCCIGGGAFIYPWAYGKEVNFSVFFEQFFVQGAWGIIPIHLSELSPPQFKAFVVGTSYQLGNLCSSASSTIEATIGERFPIYKDGVKQEGVYDYSKTMAIFMGCVFAYTLIITLIGPENRGGEINVVLSDDEIFELQEEGKLATATLQDEENISFTDNKPNVTYKE